MNCITHRIISGSKFFTLHSSFFTSAKPTVNPRTGFISNKGGTFISNEATAFISNQVFNPLNKSKMIQYEVQLNQGNEALQTGKTITANEILLTCDEKALAREIHHQNSLIPEDVAASVLGYFGKAAAQLMAMGFAVQLKNGQDVLLRIYPDVHLNGGNINLARAKELNPDVTDLTMENAGELATQVGVKVRVRCETEAKFTELLDSEGFSVERKGVKEVAYIAKKGSDGGDTDDDNTQTGGNNGSNNNPPSGELEG